MAATDARPLPKKNVAYRVYFPIYDADGDLVTGATGLDSESSIDAATFADCTNEATEVATASGIYYLDLTAAEMNGDAISVIVKTSSVGAKTTAIVLYPEEAGDIRVDVTMINGSAGDALLQGLAARAVATGAALTGTLSSTQMTTNLTEATTSHYVGRTLIWLTGVLAGQNVLITAYGGTSKIFTYTTTPTNEAPSNGDIFVIL